MKILITNHWFKRYGGSETFTYTLGKELLSRGHEVHLHTNVPGALSLRMNKEGIPSRLDSWYDLILANHNTCVEAVSDKGLIIQTCHGTKPKLEQPSEAAHYHVAISEEVQRHLEKKGFDSTVIHNGVDCERFNPTTPLNPQLKTVLSLCHSDEANALLQEACDIHGCNLITLNKYVNGLFEVETMINQSDLVVSLGRGVYEAMACGRNVVIFDKRPYQESLADGFLYNEKWLKRYVSKNCSGRSMKTHPTSRQLAYLFNMYNPAIGEDMRRLDLKYFDIKKQVDKYLQIVDSY